MERFNRNAERMMERRGPYEALRGLVVSVRGEARAILPQSLAQRMITPIRGRAALGVFSDRGAATGCRRRS